jgi:pimeloyl-ACP methyl ester carboxylesterase
MTPLAWEHWVDRYEARGCTVLTPGYPGIGQDEAGLRALRADPELVAGIGVREVMDYLTEYIGKLDARPVIMGHSFGGTFAQLLVGSGLGSAGVSIDGAGVKGIKALPFSELRSTFPILKNPANSKRTIALTPEQFHYAFTNTLSEEDALAAYERYAIPAPGSWVWSYGLIANFKPGRQETWVDFRNERRAPLLFIAGGADHIMPPSVNKSNAHHYQAPGTVTEYHEFPGRSHWTCGEPGWERVADHALDWALRHAR